MIVVVAGVIASPDTHDLLVRRRGYSYDEYEHWVRTTSEAALFAPPATKHA